MKMSRDWPVGRPENQRFDRDLTPEAPATKVMIRSVGAAVVVVDWASAAPVGGAEGDGMRVDPAGAAVGDGEISSDWFGGG
ncbi:hypothetical protein R6Q59_014941 [Mikania micrantha]